MRYSRTFSFWLTLVLSLMTLSQTSVIIPSDQPEVDETADNGYLHRSLTTCPLLEKMDIKLCDQEIKPGSGTISRRDKEEMEQRWRVAVGTICILDADGQELTTVLCTDNGWTHTAGGVDVQVSERHQTEMKTLWKRETTGNHGMQLVVGLMKAAAKGCVLYCKSQNRPPHIECPFIPAIIYADRGTNTATLLWERPTASDPEEGRIRAWRTSGVGPGVSLTKGNYQLSFMTKDSVGNVDTCTNNFHVKVRVCNTSHTYMTNGKASCKSHNLYGSKCDYSCHEGFTLIGASSSTCQSDGTWTHVKPICQDISCGPPEEYQHLQMTCSHHLLGAVCGLSCRRDGYSLVGSPSMTCQANGNWTLPGHCVDILGPTVFCNNTLTAYAGPEGTNNTVTWTLPTATDNSGQIIPVSSDPPSGVTLSPGKHNVTLTGRDAAGNKGMCYMTVDLQIMKCSLNVTAPEVADVTCSHGNVYGSVCTVSCQQGFQLVGEATVECQKDGTWSGETPQCIPKTCPAPPIISHGSYECENGQNYQDSCALTCDKGYRPVAPLTITCNISIEWSQTGECQDIQPPVFPDGCPADIVVAAARLGNKTQVIYKLPEVTDNSGENVTVEVDPKSGSDFELGQTNVTVQAIDDDGNTAVCQFHVVVTNISCKAPALDTQKKLLQYNCPDLHVHGAECNLTCPTGSPLQGPSSITCEKVADTENLEWTWTGDSKPRCKAQICPQLQAPSHGSLRCTKFKGNRGEQCLISCEDGYMTPRSVPDVYNCFPKPGGWTNDGFIPACIARRKADGAKVTPVLIYATSNCPTNKTQIQHEFSALLKSSTFLDTCKSCKVDGIDIDCTVSGRKKRAANSVSGAKLRISVEIDFGPYEDKGNVDQTRAFYKDLGDQINTALLLDSEYGMLDIPGTDYVDEFEHAPLVYSCQDGTFFSSNSMSCAGCGAGFIYDNTTDFCSMCPKGTYQDQEIAFSCTPCPSRKSTLDIRSTSEQECLDLCQPGTRSVTGIQPCLPCPKGSYQSRLGMTTCELCPFGMSTATLAATSDSDCQFYNVRMSPTTTHPTINLTSVHPANLTLSMWVHPVSSLHNILLTFSLDKNPLDTDLAYFSLGHLNIYVKSEHPSIGQTIRLWYHVALVYSSGSASLFVNGSETDVAIESQPSNFKNKTFQFTGSDAIKSLTVSGVQLAEYNMTDDEVKDLSRSCNKLLDGNILMVDQVDVSLVTPSTCDDMDDCAESPCGQHGTCVDHIGHFNCECEEPWSGDRCEVVPDYCEGHECVMGSTCANQPEEKDYQCVCPPGYRGPLCGETIVHGGWSEWGGWGPCSVTCGLGQMSRSRECDNPRAGPEGERCHGNKTDHKLCLAGVCPVDGGWGDWSAWQCSVTCGAGTAIRSRQCDNPAPSHGGLVCLGPSRDYKDCDYIFCEVDGKFGQWSDWSQCSVTCGGGVSTRRRLCDSPAPSHGGAECDVSQSGESKQCNTHVCPHCTELLKGEGHESIDCVLEEDVAMMKCNITCQAGLVLVPDTLNEFQCGRLTNYTWTHQTKDNPTGKLPICAAMQASPSQKIVLSVDYGDVDCKNPPPSADMKKTISDNLDEKISCKKSGDCTSDIKIVSTCPKQMQSTGTTTAVIIMSVKERASDNGTMAETDHYNAMFHMEEMAMQLMENAKDVFKVKVAGVDYNGEVRSARVEIACQEGSGLINGACVDCPAGSYSSSDGSCVQCEQGFYQDQPKMTSCIPCPEGLTTAGVGARNESECEGDPPDYMDMFSWSYTLDSDYDVPPDGDDQGVDGDGQGEDAGEQDLVVVAAAIGATIFLATLIGFTAYCTLRAMKRESRREEQGQAKEEEITYYNAAYRSKLSPDIQGLGKEEDPYHMYEELPAPDVGELLDD